MKNHLSIITALLLISSNLSLAQQLWTGPKITIEKENYADWQLEENQDRITDNVWLTRANNAGIFNIAKEEKFNKVKRDSPLDTEWAIGSIADGIENLIFDKWDKLNTISPAEQLNIPKVVHLISDDIYIDIIFTFWEQGGGGSGTGFGGGFSYQRSTDPSLNIEGSYSDKNKVTIYPNPTHSLIHFSEKMTGNSYTIFNSIGILVATGKISNDNTINTQPLEQGLYFISINSNSFIKFIKT